MISVYISSKLYKEARLYNTVNNFKNFFTINMIMHVCDDEIQISFNYFSHLGFKLNKSCLRIDLMTITYSLL